MSSKRDEPSLPLGAGPSREQERAKRTRASLEPKPTRTRPPFRSIGVYNYKGGCCKTFLSRELAATAVKLGLKVGLIDLDGQCNLTTWFFGGGVEAGEQDPEPERETDYGEEGEDNMDSSFAPSASNVDNSRAFWEVPEKVFQYDLAPDHPVLNIDVYRQDNLANNIFKTMTLGFTKNPDSGVPVLLSRPLEGVRQIANIPEDARLQGGELWILPGSRRIHKAEFKLNFATADEDDSSHQILAFRAIINKFKEEKDLDLIIVDCSPSSGTLNKVCIMSCDLILPPAKPDTHNLSSLHGMLTAVLPEWLEYRARYMVRAANKFRSNTFRHLSLPKCPPRLLPMTLIGFSAKNQRGAGRVGVEGVIEKQYVYGGASSWATALQEMVGIVKADAQAPIIGDLEEISRQEAEADKRKLRLVVDILTPERVDDRDIHVWASVASLQQILDHSAKDIWPVVWMADDCDKGYFNSQTYNRENPSRKAISTNEQIQAQRVLKALKSILQFAFSDACELNADS